MRYLVIVLFVMLSGCIRHSATSRSQGDRIEWDGTLAINWEDKNSLSVEIGDQFFEPKGQGSSFFFTPPEQYRSEIDFVALDTRDQSVFYYMQPKNGLHFAYEATRGQYDTYTIDRSRMHICYGKPQNKNGPTCDQLAKRIPP